MSQNEQGTLYDFRLSGSRMRQSAQQLRRQGQVVDALVLTRRAAEQELYQIEGTLKQKLLDIRNNSLGSGAEVPAEKPHADIVIEAEKEE